ncbi:MAG TPA: transglutaminase domain-containing protein [Solirubrobacteraceae bacterium]|jgi:transglutaminase-like putative cysteine protease
MSTSPQVALLPPLGRHEAAPRLRGEARRERPLIRLATFGALAAFGVERWATLDRGAPTWRLVGLIALALALAACGPILRRRSVWLASLVTVVAVIAIFPISGIPLSWVTHARVAVSVSAIGDGLSALPNVAVPYAGVDEWVRLVLVLGAAILVIDAAAMLAFAPGEPSGARRAAAAFPLIVLAALPSTIIEPQFPYLQGLILFVLLAAFLWGERIERTRVAAAVGLCAVAGIAALAIAPAIDSGKPWLDYRTLWGKLAVKSESFDWSQGYGPLNWPRSGRAVMQVRAAHPDYWKAEDLDLFGGKGWVLGDVPGNQDPSRSISRAARRRWTQTIQVTLSDMVTSQVVAAGTAGPPTHLAKPFVAGPTPGTWTANGELVPGDSYSITTYSPHPGDAELATAGTDYPAELLPGYLTIYVPDPPPFAGQLQQVVFSPFGSTRSAAYGPASADPGPVLRSSPYSQAYALATRLRQESVSPLAYVHAVEGYLARGFVYNENPVPAAYPLESFLFRTRAGYCQQFAGAMALLLRMGGVPARVAVGFTPGNYDRATRQWTVSDLDAHAWVEAWFPSYGWVRFDPTPTAAPALGGHSSIAPSTGSGASAPAPKPSGHGHGPVSASRPATTAAGRRSPAPGNSPGLAIALIVVAGLLAALAYMTRPLRGDDAELAELERAFARAGRPLGPDATLLVLERRLRSSPPAAEYVRRLRRARFGDGAQSPSSPERRALRAYLRMGLGPLGRLRAMWALPPRRARRGHA